MQQAAARAQLEQLQQALEQRDQRQEEAEKLREEMDDLANDAETLTEEVVRLENLKLNPEGREPPPRQVLAPVRFPRSSCCVRFIAYAVQVCRV